MKPADLPFCLVGDSDESGPQWSNGTRAADHEGLSVDADDIAAGRICVTSNVGNAATSCGVVGLGTFELACQVGSGKTLLTPPPVAPPCGWRIPDSLGA